jgi:hypothetical protein
LGSFSSWNWIKPTSSPSDSITNALSSTRPSAQASQLGLVRRAPPAGDPCLSLYLGHVHHVVHLERPEHNVEAANAGAGDRASSGRSLRSFLLVEAAYRDDA